MKKHFLYDNNGKLVHCPFVKQIRLYDGKIPLKNDIVQIYTYGRVKKGQYLSTYYIYGVAFATSNKEVAFGIAEENKVTDNIGLINAKIL